MSGRQADVAFGHSYIRSSGFRLKPNASHMLSAEKDLWSSHPASDDANALVSYSLSFLVPTSTRSVEDGDGSCFVEDPASGLEIMSLSQLHLHRVCQYTARGWSWGHGAAGLTIATGLMRFSDVVLPVIRVVPVNVRSSGDKGQSYPASSSCMGGASSGSSHKTTCVDPASNTFLSTECNSTVPFSKSFIFFFFLFFGRPLGYFSRCCFMSRWQMTQKMTMKMMASAKPSMISLVLCIGRSSFWSFGGSGGVAVGAFDATGDAGVSWTLESSPPAISCRVGLVEARAALSTPDISLGQSRSGHVYGCRALVARWREDRRQEGSAGWCHQQCAMEGGTKHVVNLGVSHRQPHALPL
ncbi:hypothetical protein M011DRAFT_468842 [Sporormia fimetaria CBS 119925]|uniref:Uncharacterized protein n=1 Tax=Sporormia fimetaria CBS 119925 TaxID=1340428 RepID=A0A6A6V9J0_9PLEO|nr:hypothetical protein M011DRAFT_468842 [Sporormia fimetaria CBS 119925]